MVRSKVLREIARQENTKASAPNIEDGIPGAEFDVLIFLSLLLLVLGILVLILDLFLYQNTLCELSFLLFHHSLFLVLFLGEYKSQELCLLLDFLAWLLFLALLS